MILFKNLNGCITEVSDGNMAFHAGDTTDTAFNRDKIKKSLGIESKELVFLNQIHSSIILNASCSANGCDGDALISADKNIAIGVVVADCVPMLFYDKSKSIIAAVHAGWRGSADDIAIKTVQKMQNDYECKLENICVAIGPAIKDCCYEVGGEVCEQFGLEPKKQKIDLQTINKNRLNKYGINNVEVMPVCTSCNNNFFSYRRDKNCGRIAAIIWL